MNDLTAIGFLLLASSMQFVSAQDLLSIHPGAKGGSMGSAKAIHTDVLAMYGNEAGLAFVTDLSLYASAERRFNNEGLNFYSLAAAIPSKWGSLGVLLEYYGFDLYNEQLLGLAYARKLSDQLAIGAQFDYIQVKIPSYGNNSTFTAELGVLAKLNTSTNIGFHVYNPFEIKWVEEETLPTVFSLGVSYMPTAKVWVMGEVEKVSGQKENLKAGLQYTLIDQLSLRIGVNTNPVLLMFGVGYQLENGFSIDAGSSIHQQLGISPMAGFGYQKRKSQ